MGGNLTSESVKPGLWKGGNGIDKFLERGDFRAQSASVFGWTVDYTSWCRGGQAEKGYENTVAENFACMDEELHVLNITDLCIHLFTYLVDDTYLQNTCSVPTKSLGAEKIMTRE